LIINADDFGLTSGVNRSIAECHTRGVVTSATLMATGAAMTEAAQLAASLPKLSVGCHVVLVDGAPLLPAGDIPSLADTRNGSRFSSTMGGFLQRLAAGRVDAGHIEAEATAQFRKLQEAGVNLTHFDTHKHTHLFPPVLRSLLRAARACGIGAVRNPFVPSRALAFGELRGRPVLWKRYWQTRALRRFLPKFLELLAEHGMAAPDGCVGVMETGFLDADLFAAMIQSVAEGLPKGTWEMVCHPGYDDAELATVQTRLRESRQLERQVLASSDARSLLDKSGIEMISFHELRPRA